MPKRKEIRSKESSGVSSLPRPRRRAPYLAGRYWAGLGVLVALSLFVNASSNLAALEHVVVPGDTLSGLASRYGVTVEELAELNRIANPNLIFVGDTLRIPDSGADGTGTPATTVPPIPPGSSGPSPSSTIAPATTVPIFVPTVTPPPPPPIPGSPADNGPATTAPPTPTTPPTTQPVVTAVSPNPPTTEPPTPPTTAPPTTQPTAPQPTVPPPTSSPPPAPDPQDADGDGQDDGAELPEGVESVVVWSPYTIRPGDWLSSIAERYDTTVEELARVNTLTNTNLIYVGQVILVPTSRTGSSPDATPSPTSGFTVEQRLDYWASRYNVPPEMLKALTWWESGWNNNAISSAGAIGIGQLLPSTAEFVADVLIGEELNPHVVDDNIRMTARFVRYLLDETGNDRRLALASYYQGLFAVRRYGIYNISKPYVNGILALQDRFR